jgi:acetolactate synthase-1/2/3 large subunit
MQVSTAVVDRLAAGGVEAVFGIPGKQSLPLNEAIAERDGMRFVVARHETAVSHQAWGYAETSGRPAATVVVPGPGDMNAMNGLKSARNDCTPLVHVAVETEPELRGGDAIHETPPDTYDNVVTENLLVRSPEAAAATVDRAVAAALTPPMGPVRVGIPKNFLRMDRPLAASERGPGPAPAVPASAVEEAAALLGEADRPVVLAGGGVRSAGASDPLRRVAERLGAPDVTSYKGKGTVAEDHPLSAGTLAGSAPPELLDCLAEADAALAVGTDLDAVATRGSEVALPEALVHVTLDPDDVGTGYRPAVAMVADAGDALTALEGALETAGIDRADDGRAAGVRAAARERIEPLLDDEPPLSSVRALRAVREALPRETIVAVDAGGFRVWALNTFDAYGPRRYVNPGSWATMGTGLPSAIGARLANPDAPVAALTGDGGLLMCVHELHTAAAEGIPVTVVVFVNDDYAIISEEAGRRYRLSADEYAWGGAPVSFTAVAEGMGVTATEADTPAAIEDAVGSALAAAEPRLVAVHTDPDEPQAGQFMRD